MKLHRSIKLFILLFLGTLQYASAQQINLKGVVTDASKNPIPGVSILILGEKQKGTMTDFDGKFVLQVKKGNKLRFSYLGMQEKEILITNQQTLSVVLDEGVEYLDEIVIIGYESVKRSDLTGSVSSIKGSDIVKQATPNLASALVGKASGVYVRNTGSEPGGGTSIKIRGLNTINGTGEPLYVIDGIYAEDINFLNPTDVESIEILKDASATAIYGSRGANGVVLITTKTAKSGKTRVSYAHFYAYKDMARKLDLVNAEEYATLFYEMKAAEPNIILPEEEIPGFPENDPDSWSNGSDWLQETRQFWALANHDFKINYGSDSSALGFGVNYVKDDGAFKGQSYERLTINFNGKVNISKAIEFGYSMNGVRTNFDQLRDGQRAIAAIYGTAPVIPIYNEDGSYNFNNVIGEPNQFENPLSRLENSIDLDQTDRVLSNMFVNIKFGQGFKLAASLKYNYRNRERKSYLPSNTLEGAQTNGVANINSQKVEDITNNYILTKSLKLNKHNFTFLGGMEIGKRTGTSQNSGNITQFNTDLYGPFNLGAGASIEGYDSEKNQETLLGYIGRINYKYNNKYFLTLTARYDGSSKFGAENKWNLFPGIALAYDMSKEKFLANSEVVSSWKWRLSAGQSGSSSIQPYQSQGSIFNLGLSATGPSYVFGDNVIQGEVPQSFDNPNLKWETTTQYNLGVDISLWRGRFNFSADIYHKAVSDLLLRNFQLPGVSGFDTTTVNAGDMVNTGVDISFGGNILKKGDFSFSSNVVFSHYKNEVTKWIGEGQLIRESRYTGYAGEGYAYGVFWEVPQLGVFPDQAAIDNYTFTDPDTGVITMIQPVSVPGDIQYQDTNGDGRISADDRTKVGSPHPDFTLGMGFDFKYKRWSLNTYINAVVGKDIYNASNEQLMDTHLFSTVKWNNSFGDAITASSRMLNRWTPENTITDVPRMGSKGYDGVSANLSNVENGDFIRLENISLTYAIPTEKLKSISNLSVFGSVQNAFLITNYSGTDPDANQVTPGGWDTNQGAGVMGFESFGYPRPVIYTLGFNINF
ncbi:TonB-dependent receptor [Polaribacter sp. Hel_I_88]|uniref:SusC/RagA family TonB-linked outer membrane protein n=1 Tax=Polaribacter sp. Hel_I_88 TaxID=1250006 RepID=UPI00047CF1A9|nr:TonB-dependent receptor [Polaribacter sp. Hel_I_88]